MNVCVCVCMYVSDCVYVCVRLVFSVGSLIQNEHENASPPSLSLTPLRLTSGKPHKTLPHKTSPETPRLGLGSGVNVVVSVPQYLLDKQNI